MKVITDHKWKDLRYSYEVPKSVIKKQFDWIEDPEIGQSFFKYRNYWYHLSEFMSCHNEVWSHGNPYKSMGWDGYHTNSYFSAVLVKISEDGEQYQVATCYS